MLEDMLKALIPLICHAFRVMELAPYFACAKQVVKASLGHIPQPFLISDVCQKELLQSYRKAQPIVQHFFYATPTDAA